MAANAVKTPRLKTDGKMDCALTDGNYRTCGCAGKQSPDIRKGGHRKSSRARDSMSELSSALLLHRHKLRARWRGWTRPRRWLRSRRRRCPGCGSPCRRRCNRCASSRCSCSSCCGSRCYVSRRRRVGPGGGVDVEVAVGVGLAVGVGEGVLQISVYCWLSLVGLPGPKSPATA
jgi:hypothetical protein